ncbi:LutB/LldF family L-lactate oxidation iron-sulfur protein [Effusibacillus lacus]|uniref:Iron-sulfur cluster-binding protein n=1 Tax=Effusibacillus lacus TaxID=1348429 RepID=A0A292YI36_9BACL|nr:LutB/LldF family L-lactate oxidation iron-sulfur protein [Effusibacillus lacus]TCS70525.1 L-lactate dehydrogenase complex protein LldF [Effusibacillus lacus]GAX89528.1 iron-sulfur cluster-binding protein [Effusibacillus lacus]
MSVKPALPLKERMKHAIADETLIAAVKKTTDRLEGGKLSSSEALGNWEEWRKQGSRIRSHVVEHLDYYLGQLIENVKKRGGHVHIADSAKEAVDIFLRITREKNAKSVIKSKSMVSEEVHVNKALEDIGVEVIESDLGEYIIQLFGEAPSHIIVPAIHKNRYQIKDKFNEISGENLTEDTPTLTAFARRQLRKAFLQADIGVSGCNFAIAETGSIVMFTNEGNGRMVTTLPPVHVAFMGMERLIPSFEDLETFVNLLPRSATGQKITTYVSVINGARQEGDLDGAQEFHLIIVDNGRSKILGDEEFQEVLNCIRCGACLNVCPVYRHIGGHAYGDVYPGPIGAVLTPLLRDDMETWGDLPYASSLCGACTEACPVRIPLHDMLVRHRARYVKLGLAPKWEQMAFKAWSKTFARPGRYKLSMKAARLMVPFMARDGFIEKGPLNMMGWTHARHFPSPAKQSFREQWSKLSGELKGGGDHE